MRRPVRIGIIFAEVMAGLALARIAQTQVPRLRDWAAARTSRPASQEQMESLLGRCHGLVETTRVRQRVVPPAQPVPTPVRVA